ncbi:Uncharacterised protein [uncultured Ruminococcus sp.]|nr:Uncharacterised protein [uncultured Ruminococcus sp.]
MKKIILIVCTLVFLISLTACGTEFDGSRTGNDSEFIMEYSVLNTTDAQDLTIEAGDTISAKIVVDKGSLSIKIQKDGEEPIYESNEISTSNEFDVEIDESGTYTVEVTGKKAKGSVSFIVQSN